MRRILLLLVLVLLIGGAVWLTRSIGWGDLAQNQDRLLAWVSGHPVESAALYTAAYVVTAALSLPHGALLTVAGGLLFGGLEGTVLTVIGATIGASILLVVLRTTLIGTLDRQRSRIPEAMRARLTRDGFSYLLAIRLVPLFPFWLVNLAAVVAGLRLMVFVPATLLGVLPATFVLTEIGAGVGGVLAEGRTPDLGVLFSARILLPMLGLAALSLLPVLVRLRRRGAHA